jgi:restriction endonuclease S subunit
MYPLTPQKETLSKFLLFVILSEWFTRFAVLESERVAMPKVNRESLNNCFVVLPPQKEQQAIASFLDRETAKIDALIARKERLIELLQEKRTAIISHAVTKGLDPTVQMKDSGVEWLGEIPKHWKVRRNKALFRLFNGYAFKGEYFSNEEQDVPILITPGNFNPDGGLYFTEDNTTYYTGDYPSAFCLKPGEQQSSYDRPFLQKANFRAKCHCKPRRITSQSTVAKIILHKKYS